jgi:hypothetical protein
VRHEGPFEYVHDSTAGMYLPSRMRHVGSPLFAVIVCRKFATVAAFSWYLPHQKKCRLHECERPARDRPLLKWCALVVG